MTLASDSHTFREISDGNIPCHPGLVLVEEFLKPRGITQTLLAHVAGIPSRHLSEIIRGMRKITPPIALRLAAGLGTSALDWLVQQARYDLWREECQTGDMPYGVASTACVRQLHRHPQGEAFACLATPLPGTPDASAARARGKARETLVNGYVGCPERVLVKGRAREA